MEEGDSQEEGPNSAAPAGGPDPDQALVPQMSLLDI